MKFLFSYILQQVYRIDFYQDNFRKKKIFEKKKRNLLTSNIKSKSYFESNHFICFQHSQNILNPQIFVNIPNESISHREIFQNDSFFFFSFENQTNISFYFNQKQIKMKEKLSLNENFIALLKLNY